MIGYTRNVYNNSLAEMFLDCSNLTNIELGTEWSGRPTMWDTSNVTDIFDMFYGCHNVTNLYIPGWNMSKLETYMAAFAGMGKIQDLNMFNWKMKNFNWIVNEWPISNNIINLDIAQWQTTGEPQYVDFNFNDRPNLQNINIANWNTIDLVYCNFNFDNCINLNILDLTNWNLDHPYIMDPIFTFKRCNNLSDNALKNIANALLSGTHIEGGNLYPNYQYSLFYQSSRYINNTTVGSDIVNALRAHDWDIPE